MLGRLLGLLFFFWGVSLYAETLTICHSCDIKSIKEGVVKAADHDTLLIKKGIYKEYDIIIDKPLVLKGENYPVIDGGEKGEIITIVSDHVTVDGLFVINVGTSYTEDYAAIRVIKSRDFLIQNNVLENLFFGIYLEKAQHGKVYHNKIVGDAVEEFNSGNGIQLWYCRNIEVERNIVQHVRDGIYLEFSDDILIKDNISSKNVRYGLHFMFSNNDTYVNNIFEDNGAGVAVIFSKKKKNL
ncbi:MAG: NosD domain-containing protein, partial [Flavobacteriaceae bacterium]